MSRRDSFGRGGLALAKLKEGLQEAIVFLQTLGSYRIPAVIERRRKELLDRLSLLQGGTVKEEIPVIEPKEDEIPPSKEDKLQPNKKQPTVEVKGSPNKAPTKEGSESSSSASSSAVTSPTHGGKLQRRDSALVSSLVKDYESIHYSAKKEEEHETPKRFVTLKKVTKPTDFPADKNDSSTKEPEKDESSVNKEKKKEKDAGKEVESVSAGKTEQDKLEVTDAKRERASSVVSGDESEEEEEEEKGKKKKKGKKGGGFGSKMKGLMKRDKSPAPERKHPPPAESPVVADEDAEGEDQAKGEEAVEVEEELEEGVRISGVLERMKKKIGHKKVKSVNVKVCETMMMIGDKEEVELTKCTVEATDVGFELTHPQHKSPFMFKLEGDEVAREKWVTALREAIQKATPPIEEKPEVEDVAKSLKTETVPSITVEEIASTTTSKKAKRESKALTIKPEKKLPDQGVTMKGYIHRKKPGLSRSWEKTYCVLTFQAMYFTTEVDNKEYSNMLAIYPDMGAKLENKKGKNADSPGLCLKMGKKVELFSFDNQQEFRSWKTAMENVLGLGGVEELLSEDEELDGGGDPEELYEELELDEYPPVPASPRPSHPSFNAPPVSKQEDDFIIDEDIYEDTDDILPSMPQPSQSPQHVPSLPNRNPPKASTMTSTPAPSLPPRNAPAPASISPRLPPHPAPGKLNASLPQDYEMTGPGGKPATKAPAPPPPSATADDDGELYDDVLLGGEENVEEMYDDVVIGAEETGDGEELYDDVMAVGENGDGTGEPITDEFYEDMAPGAVSDPYVEMVKEEQTDPGDELYVDVNEPPPIKKVVPEVKSSSSKTSKMFNKKTSSITRGILSGNVSYKAPKKSKFEDRWGTVEGSYMHIYKSPSDKRSQDKISLGDCRLNLGSTEAGAGKYAFSLSKGDKFYHISLREKVEVDKWVDVLKGIVKYAPVEMGAGIDEEEQDIYQAKEDHIANSGNELTFKKGTYIKVLERKSKDMWYGQIGDESQVFQGKKGTFPTRKVELAEDIYIN